MTRLRFFLRIEIKFEPVYKVTQCFIQNKYALLAKSSRNFLFSINLVSSILHSSRFEHKIPVLWSSTISLKAPKQEAIVQVLTKLASIHFISDLASLKIDSVSGARLISILEINSGSFL